MAEKKAGGERPGAGRKPLPPSLKKRPITVKLSPQIADWLRERGESQSATIEEALIAHFELKPPKTNNPK